jgi:hypothetical protein
MDILSDEFQAILELLGFKHLGSFWYCNEDDSIRIRLWKDNEAIFWDWRGEGNEYNEIRFKGELIHPSPDVAWILRRCFK